MARTRADQLLVTAGLAPDLAAARTLILAGRVRVGADHLVRKASETYAPDTAFTIAAGPRFVGRGGHKIEAALDRHLPDLAGRVALDLGAATGGFTDLLLQRGAARVYAVDVGRGLLHQRLREHPRVVVLEGTHARDLNRELVPDPIAVLSADLSFTSLARLLPPVAGLLAPGAWVFALVKPQFEAPREAVGAGGIVRDPAVRAAAVAAVRAVAEGALGWRWLEAEPSPITGARGNQEYVAVCRVP